MKLIFHKKSKYNLKLFKIVYSYPDSVKLNETIFSAININAAKELFLKLVKIKKFPLNSKINYIVKIKSKNYEI